LTEEALNRSLRKRLWTCKKADDKKKKKEEEKKKKKKIYANLK